jgi:hypothetical protein
MAISIFSLFLAAGLAASGQQDQQDGPAQPPCVVAARPTSLLARVSDADMAIARALCESGRDRIELLVAVRQPQASTIIDDLSRAGARIVLRRDDLGYARIRLPLARLLEGGIPGGGVIAVGVDRNLADRDLVARRSGTGWSIAQLDQFLERNSSAAHRLESPPAGRAVPASSAPRDTGTLALRSDNPTFDGRGVTIALLDRGFPDFGAPELAGARDLDGNPIGKIRAVHSMSEAQRGGPGTSEPDAGSSGATVMLSGEMLPGSDGTIGYARRRFHLSTRSGVRIGIFTEPEVGASFGQEFLWDINQDGVRGQSFAMLWSPAEREIRIDMDGDGDFAEERAIPVRPDGWAFGMFGADRPETPLRESLYFAARVDEARNAIILHPGTAGHATLMWAASAGSRDAGGVLEGVAPASQVVFVDTGHWRHGHIEGVLFAIEQGHADVVSYSRNSYLTPVGMDGETSVEAVILSRIVDRFDVPILCAGSNTSGLATVDTQCSASNLVTVGAYQSGQSYLDNLGVSGLPAHNQHYLSAYGPGWDGRLKPDFLAPSGDSGNLPAFLALDPSGNAAAMTPGYALAGGTSQALPTAVGAYAVIISAARQRGIDHSVARLNSAFRGSAEFLSNLPAYQQGRGRIRVDRAWALMQRDSREIDVRVEAPLATGRPEHAGPGLFERAAWRPGQTAVRTIRITRRSGPEREDFSCRWRGDPAFSGSRLLRSHIGRETRYDVSIAPTVSGVHSALLTCSDPGGSEFSIPSTIVSSEPWVGDQISRSLDVRYPGSASLFADAQQGDSLRLQASSSRPFDIVIFSPASDTISRTDCATRSPDGKYRCETRLETSLSGQWEFLVRQPRIRERSNPSIQAEPATVDLHLRRTP